LAPHGVTGQFDPMGVVDEAIEDGVGIGRGADHFMPPGHRELAGNERRAMTIAVLEDFQQMVPGITIERFQPPVIEDEQVNAGRAFQTSGDAAIALGKRQIVDQPWQPCVEDRAVVAACLSRAGKTAAPACPHASQGEQLLAIRGRHRTTHLHPHCARYTC